MALTHGKTNTFEFNVWVAMRKRCNYIKHPKYYLYGGRGISVCNRWQNSFVNFLEDMGKCPYEKGSIDRISNSGNYEPNNCRWLPKNKQSTNRRCVRLINGMSLTAYAEKNDVPASTLRLRIQQGWDIDKLLTIRRERNKNALCKQKTALQA
jgi:hypothetical protein